MAAGGYAELAERRALEWDDIRRAFHENALEDSLVASRG